MHTAASKTRNHSRLQSYSALTAAFLASAEALSGAVVYTDVVPDSMVANGIFPIDMDADGFADFELVHYGFTSAYGAWFTSLQSVILRGVGSGYGRSCWAVVRLRRCMLPLMCAFRSSSDAI